MQNFAQSRNKLGYVYVLTPNGMTEKVDISRRFLLRKMAEYEALKTEIQALQAEVNTLSGEGTQKA